MTTEPNNQPAPELSSQEDLIEFHRLIFPDQSIEDIDKAVTHQTETLKDTFASELNKLGSYTELLNRVLETYSSQLEFVKESLRHIKDPKMTGDAFEYQADANDPDDTSFTLKNRVLNIDSSLKGAEVSGHQARMLVLAANKNIKKIYLYNTGINIVLRSPTLGEVNLAYNRLDGNMQEYGRMMGSIGYMYADHVIISAVWDFVESLIIGSNLNKWDSGNRLKNTISFLDYQHIILTIASLIFKNGYDFHHICTNTECRHTTTESIDLNLLQLTDFSKVPTEYLRKLSSNAQVTPDDVRQYKKALNTSAVCTIGNYRIHRKVPSMQDHLLYGEKFNEEFFADTRDITGENIIEQYLKYNYCRIFAPWISYIEILDDAGEISFKVVESDAISMILNQLTENEYRQEFIKQMETYIYDMTITNIGYAATPCPVCGKEPSNVVNGFIPIDAQSSFFTMLVMRLIQNS